MSVDLIESKERTSAVVTFEPSISVAVLADNSDVDVLGPHPFIAKAWTGLELIQHTKDAKAIGRMFDPRMNMILD